MKKLLIALVLLLFPALTGAAQGPARYAIAVAPTPVLNTPDFRQTFEGTVRLDPCEGVRPIEFVALPGTLFTVEGELQNAGVTVYRVKTLDYPYGSTTGYFVDARFVKSVEPPAGERPRVLPALAEVQKRLLAALGRPYVWGGNLQDGVPRLRDYYPQADILAGVDCSGLLYQATDGFTPRNTSALTAFGTPLAVAGLSAEAIAKKLRPLDLIVWKGHVMIVLDWDNFIESVMGCGGGGSGVRLVPLREGLRRVMKKRRPLDDYPAGTAGGRAFVVRRWFSRED